MSPILSSTFRAAFRAVPLPSNALQGAYLLVSLACVGAANAQPYRDARQPIDVRARDLLSRMTLEEKFWQLFMLPGGIDDPSHDYTHGVYGLQVSVAPDGREVVARGRADAGMLARQHAERINSIQSYLAQRSPLGIPMLPFEEALHGLKSPGATVFPQAIGLGASWDSALVRRVAEATAREAGSRGIRHVLSPVLNIADDVRWGRVEETYGEDPFLVATLGSAFVSAFERAGILTTAKHFIANVGAGGRDSYPIDFSDRQLREYYFPPFEAALRAGASSVMSAYNAVDGLAASQSRYLLTEVLRQRWRFPGLVISDAAATAGATVLHYTEPTTASAAKHALEAGLDVIFQSSWEQHRPYLAAFASGVIDKGVIDSAVMRVLRTKLRLGLFERPYADPDSAAFWNGHPTHRSLAYEAAAKSLVLLKNERRLLPLSRRTRTIAVIGEDASTPRLGGYSGPGIAPVSILDGIRAAAGNQGVVYAPGPGRRTDLWQTVPSSALRHTSDGVLRPGLTGSYFDNPNFAGEPRVRRIDNAVDFHWTLSRPAPELALDWYSVRWEGVLVAPVGGLAQLGVRGNDGYRLWLDGRLLIDQAEKRSHHTQLVNVALRGGSTHQIRLEFSERRGDGEVRLVWREGAADVRSKEIVRAVRAARASSAAVVVVGVEEGEFRDRSSLSLPGRQNELIERVAATGTPTVVVVVGGSAITMPWLDRVAAVLYAWYPGEVGGSAVGDALFGALNPGGRLPMTFPVSEGQLPLVYNHKPTGRGDDYVDGSGLPLFPFGYGLSYSAFAYDSLRIVNPASARDSGTISFVVENVSARDGDEVVQLYIRDLLASRARPVQQLAGFQRVGLRAGERRQVTMRVAPAQLAVLDGSLQPLVEPGEFRVMVGSSSRDIRLKGVLRIP